MFHFSSIIYNTYHLLHHGCKLLFFIKRHPLKLKLLFTIIHKINNIKTPSYVDLLIKLLDYCKEIHFHYNNITNNYVIINKNINMHIIKKQKKYIKRYLKN
jgi:hypothetical protein